MPNTIKTITLSDNDRNTLNKLLAQSTIEVRTYQRAKILLYKADKLQVVFPSFFNIFFCIPQVENIISVVLFLLNI